MKNLKNTIVGIGIAALAMGTGPARAQSNANRTESVNFADLNLGQSGGQASFEHRIKAAASRVCSNDGQFDLQSVLASHKCYTAAVTDGMSQMKQVIASRDTGVKLAASSLVIRAK